MAKRKASTRQRPDGGMIIGRRRFAAISAVDGIKLTPEMERRAAELDRSGLSADERIKVIVSCHRKV